MKLVDIGKPISPIHGSETYTFTYTSDIKQPGLCLLFSLSHNPATNTHSLQKFMSPDKKPPGLCKINEPKTRVKIAEALQHEVSTGILRDQSYNHQAFVA